MAARNFLPRCIVFFNRIDHFHNDINSFEILPWTSLASISCGPKSQKRALLLATHEIVLYVSLYRESPLLPRIEFNCETGLFLQNRQWFVIRMQRILVKYSLPPSLVQSPIPRSIPANNLSNIKTIMTQKLVHSWSPWTFMRAVESIEAGIALKALIQPAYLARVASWLAFVVAIFVVHEMATTKANQEMAPAKHAGWIRAFKAALHIQRFERAGAATKIDSFGSDRKSLRWEFNLFLLPKRPKNGRLRSDWSLKFIYCGCSYLVATPARSRCWIWRAAFRN